MVAAKQETKRDRLNTQGYTDVYFQNAYIVKFVT